ncbi:flagellar assembly protein FliW [Paenibacillus gansuensis]|uniref:Flagellar assembly factor FliW n=1 Tax=Paenibacillus gansuensis TaxID=306542 RepID=A0ABW5PKV8_9BACL
MKLETKYLGEVEVQEQDIITFNEGIPGFKEYRQYVILQVDESVSIYYLQSVDTSELSFVITNPFVFYPEYELEIPQDVLEQLRIEKTEEVAIYTILTIKETLKTATVNLLAPLIINLSNRQAKQVVLINTEYETKHSLIGSA